MIPTSKPPALIFDLDGTLVDTAPDLLAALNTLMMREGRRLINPLEMRHLVGRGAKILIEQAFAETGDPIGTTEIDRLFEDYLVEYGAHIADTSQPYPGVVETLEDLRDQGVRMAVLTNKPHAMAEAILPALGLSQYFSAVYGAGRKDYMKPDPRIFADILTDIGGGPAVMVGDSITDVQMARNAGVPAVVVPYGYSPEPVESLGADALVSCFAEVPKAAFSLL